MTEDDVLFGQRVRLFTLAEELGNVSEACRLMGFHRSTYYALKHKVDRWGLEALRVRERRRPRMANQIGPHLEQRIIAFALARPGCGPRRISAELRRPKWGGIRISEHDEAQRRSHRERRAADAPRSGRVNRQLRDSSYSRRTWLRASSSANARSRWS
jgi:hypothetical protein